MSWKLLVINPGSTSTKIAIFENEKRLLETTLRHSMEELSAYNSIYDQFSFRQNLIEDFLRANDIQISDLDAVVARGGLLRPLEGGTYLVNEKMLEDLKVGFQGQHASNLGGVIANNIAKAIDKPSFIVDPVVVDEMDDVARITGVPGIKRKSIFHALNQKAVARRLAADESKEYKDLNIIVAHLGGGISVGAHQNGRIIDVNDALDGDGPFSPERAGSIPAGTLVKMCFSQEYTLPEIKKMLTGKGGLVAHLGTNDAREVSNRAQNGDKDAKLLYDAMAYQVAKEIGSCAAVLKGKVDAIVITGGIAYDTSFVKDIADRVSFIAPVKTYPGEDELVALAEGALRVLRKEEEAKEYNAY